MPFVAAPDLPYGLSMRDVSRYIKDRSVRHGEIAIQTQPTNVEVG